MWQLQHFLPCVRFTAESFAKKDKDKKSLLKVEESTDVMDIFKPITKAFLPKQAYEI